jgi:hypothetical protein
MKMHKPPTLLFVLMSICMTVAVTPPSTIHKIRIVMAQEIAIARGVIADTAIAPAVAQDCR